MSLQYIHEEVEEIHPVFREFDMILTDSHDDQNVFVV
jgi:hypothetical protein